MERWYRWMTVGVVLLTVRFCGDPAPPKLGPVQTREGRPDRGVFTLAASTNCAMPGETITFTLRVENPASYALEFVDPPLFDMTIEKINGPQIRWSDSDQYPPDINPVFALGEVREYQWLWVPTLEGALVLELHIATLPAALSPRDIPPDRGSVSLAFGVNSMSWDRGGVGGPIACTELRR